MSQHLSGVLRRTQNRLANARARLDKLERLALETAAMQQRRLVWFLEKRLDWLQQRMAQRPAPAPKPPKRRNRCVKHQFTQAKALRMAAKRRQETGEAIYGYPCPFGEHWHIGHPPRGRA